MLWNQYISNSLNKKIHSPHIDALRTNLMFRVKNFTLTLRKKCPYSDIF